MSPELQKALADAVARFEALSPEEKIAHMQKQRESWVRGEMAMGDEGTRIVRTHDPRSVCPRDRCYRRSPCEPGFICGYKE
jgi:hypothetical protein